MQSYTHTKTLPTNHRMISMAEIDFVRPSSSSMSNKSRTRRKHNIPKLKLPVKQHLDKPLKAGTLVLENKLYISGYEQAINMDFIKSNRISAIISLYNEPLPREILAEVNFNRLQIDIDDHANEDIKQYFNKVNCFIKKHDTVLVHCQAGRSRSASCVLAYLMAEHGYTFNQAYGVLKKSRDIISPNFAFLGQLVEWEQELMSSPEWKKKFVFPQVNVRSRKRKSESESGGGDVKQSRSPLN